MSDGKPFPLSAKPGIKRDGTRTEGEFCTDGEWVRWNRLGRPRKMGGYAKISQLASGPVYGFKVFPQGGVAYAFCGSETGVEVQNLTLDAVYSAGPIDRTVSGGATNPNYVWSFDTIYDPLGLNAPVVLAHGAPNLSDIDSAVTVSTYYGSLVTTSALIDTGAPQSSGGVVVLHPYVFVYGSAGQVAWSEPGLPATWTSANIARITGSKIVYAAPVRGGAGQAPAGLFWSLDAVVRATFATGGPTDFNFDTVTAESSILSSRCVVEFDGLFYWIGTDRFLFYNGVVRELPNPLNSNDFFTNVNMSQRQKVWGTKIPRWGEIWWFYPRGSATDANHAVIYNVTLQTWYDTPIPEGGRSDGFFAQVVPNPIWCGVEPDSIDQYPLWKQEVQDSFDKSDNGVTGAIRSFFQTQDYTFADQGRLNNTRITRIELDVTQNMDMTVERIGYAYPRSSGITTTSTFTESDVYVDDNIRGQARYLFLKFTSNVGGGFYEFGDTKIWIEPGDTRPGGG